MEALTFHSNGSKLVATLRSPTANGKGVPSPGILVMGSWLTVKEQMAENYARLLAELGFATLTFDFRGFGASEGGPREVESARSKAEDILNAAAFLRTRPEIDPRRIGVLAICASASYCALALQGMPAEECPIQSAAMVAPWIHDRAIIERLYGGPAAVAERLARASAAREHYAKTGAVEYIAAASATDSSAAMYAPGDVYDYYLNPQRAALPSWGGRFGVMGWTEWLEADFVALGPGFSVPLCVVTGEGTATPDGVRRFVRGLPRPAEVVSSDGTQFDFYDNPQNVRFAAERAAGHFRKTFGSA